MRISLSEFLETVNEPLELLSLLDGRLFINPSDLFAVARCETRLRCHSYDRRISTAIFLADVFHDALHETTSEFSAVLLRATFDEAIIILFSDRPADRLLDSQTELSEAFLRLADLAASPIVDTLHQSFKRKFADWRQMVRSCRRMKAAQQREFSVEYGELTQGLLVADRVGNMLSQVRHQYCDRAFKEAYLVLE